MGALCALLDQMELMENTPDEELHEEALLLKARRRDERQAQGGHRPALQGAPRDLRRPGALRFAAAMVRSRGRAIVVSSRFASPRAIRCTKMVHTISSCAAPRF